MPPSPENDKDLAEWIELWQIGELDEVSQAALLARLEEDPGARRMFLEAARLEALLQLEFPDTLVHIPKARNPWFRRAAIPLTAAAAIALTAGSGAIWWTLSDRSDENTGTVATVVPPDSNQPSKLIDSTPVARLDSLKDLKVAPGCMPLEKGELLRPGTIHLDSGEAELTFFSGARVSLKGPCEFILKSDFRASLKKGRVTAQVPKEAIGFTIHTPTGQLRDLGTSFAVNVQGDGVSDVHVLEGEVEALSRDGSSIITLGVNQASRIANGGLTPIAFTAEGWPDRPTISTESPLPESVHWSFDHFQGNKTLDENGVHPLWIRGGGQSHTSRSRPGIHGPALDFNGKGQFAESSYRGIPGNKPRTVSLWVNVPPDASYEFPNGILSWGKQEQSRKWQICWNNGNQGTVGALRVEFGDGYLIGTTDLRDGLWHHLCVVFLGGIDDDVASQVKLYVDGRLETLSGRRSQLIRTDTESPQSAAVTLGRWLGYWPGKAPFYFRGGIDEVRIFESSLTPAQVAVLAEPGRD